MSSLRIDNIMLHHIISIIQTIRINSTLTIYLECTTRCRLLRYTLRSSSLTSLQQYGYTNIANAPNTYEDNQYVRSIRNILYNSNTDTVNIVEFSLRTYFEPDYVNNRNHIVVMM